MEDENFDAQVYQTIQNEFKKPFLSLTKAYSEHFYRMKINQQTEDGNEVEREFCNMRKIIDALALQAENKIAKMEKAEIKKITKKKD